MAPTLHVLDILHVHIPNIFQQILDILHVHNLHIPKHKHAQNRIKFALRQAPIDKIAHFGFKSKDFEH